MVRLARAFALCTAALLAADFAPRQALGAEKAGDPISTFVDAARQKQHIPGLALLVSRRGKIERAEGFGFANLEHDVPVKPETIFQSGSVGKQFTATAVMMLVGQGKIGLDDSITKYLAGTPETWKPITVRQLLSHTAGLGDYDDTFDMRRDATEAELLRLIVKTPLLYPPGTGWSYSNLGYVTLGILVHQMSGQFYGDYLRERVFKPLGMTTTRVISESDLVPNRAAGYLWTETGWKNQEWVAPTLNTTADGALYFSILDLAKWDAALYGDAVLPQAALAQMWTAAKLANGEPNKRGYGFGWFVHAHAGRRLIEHDGEWQGFSCTIARYVDDGVTVVVLANLADAATDEIAHGVAERVLAAPR